ncbi:MAG: DUF1360 domain-containing protein [Acidobacteriota bacterium]
MPDGHVCWLVVGVLGVWRVAHLVTAEDGPWGAVATARRWAGHGVLGQLVDCFNCTSLWVAAAWSLSWPEPWTTRALLTLALSGGAVLLERGTDSGARAGTASFVEEEPHGQEDHHGVLRR